MIIGNVEHKCASCVYWSGSFYTPFEHCTLHEGVYGSHDSCNDFKEKRQNAYRLPNDIYDRKYDRPISKEEVKKKLVGEKHE